jgi:hypothetical protein
MPPDVEDDAGAEDEMIGTGELEDPPIEVELGTETLQVVTTAGGLSAQEHSALPVD